MLSAHVANPENNSRYFFLGAILRLAFFRACSKSAFVKFISFFAESGVGRRSRVNSSSNRFLIASSSGLFMISMILVAGTTMPIP